METNIPDRLKQLRETANLTQSDMAEILDVKLQSYQRFEYGSRRPSLDVLIALADYFGVSLDYLVGISDNPKRNQLSQDGFFSFLFLPFDSSS